MALVINTNISSLSAQNSISRAQMDQNEAMERLTTGKRINTAADDAAGLAIANKMTSQVSGLNQAVRNANDGISMLQTAAGGLEETNNILQRMRELAVQSASGTYDQGNRDSMQAEVEQLQAELDRISETTTFNGQNILDGSQDDVSLQVGANSNETIDFSIGSTAAKELGSKGADIVGDLANDYDGGAGTGTGLIVANGGLYDELTTAVTGAVNTDGMYVNGQDVGDLSALDPATDGLQDLLDEMNSNLTGVEAGVLVEWTADSVGDGVLQGTDGLEISFARLDVADDDLVTAAETIKITNTGSLQEVVDQINEKGAGAITADITDDGRLTLSSTSLSYMNLSASDAINTAINADAALGASALGMDVTEDAGEFGVDARLTFTADAGVDNITVTYDTPADANLTGVNTRREAGTLTGVTALAQPADATVIKSGDLMLNGVALDGYDPASDYDGNATAGEDSDIISWINAQSSETGVVASLDDTDDPGTTYVLKLTSLDGEEVSFDYKDTLTETERAAIETSLGMQENNAVKSAGGSVANIDISTADGAQKAIDVLDAAIDQVSDIQGELGAVNNRLDFTVSNLSNVSENAAAARSRIQDADFAAESANLSRAQVLQQAGQAMLAQANSAPQQVLSLLQ